MIDLSDPFEVLALFLALGAGGVLKGAIGMGSPVIAVPVMASFFDVRLAVVIMVIPNLITNLRQLYTFRKSNLPGAFRWVFAGAGALGALFGTVVLAHFSPELLMIIVAVAVFLYVALRLASPNLTLPPRLATPLAGPIGFLAGLLQGAAGISAPISASFLSAMHLPRATFIPTISLFFAGMSVSQIPAMLYYDLMTKQLMLLGFAAVLPLFLGMPVGSWLARNISARAFDRVILVMLSLLALKLFLGAIL